jgi:hypothetical protein
MKRFWEEFTFEPGEDRPMIRAERIEARHLLQVLSEDARGVRNAMDPVHGVHTVTRDGWRAQYEALIAELKYFTERLS